jgi:hypothetical protein
LRVDNSISARDHLSLTYDVVNFGSLTGDPFAGAIPIAGGGGADSADQTTSSNHSVSATYTRIVSPTQLNVFRAGFVHTFLAQNTLIHGDVANQLGIGGVNLSNFPTTSGLPQIYLASGTSPVDPLIGRLRSKTTISALLTAIPGTTARIVSGSATNTGIWCLIPTSPCFRLVFSTTMVPMPA